MLNLIKRDAIIQKKQLYIFIPFMLFFIVMQVPPILLFLVISIYIPLNAYAYDEKAETNVLLNSLPYTRKQIIAARYIGSVFYIGLSVILAVGLLLLLNQPFKWIDVGIGVTSSILFTSIAFPMFYIFKRGYVSLGIMIAFFALVGFVPRILPKIAVQLSTLVNFVQQLSLPTIYGSVAVITLIIYLISWLITMMIYERKAF